MGGNMESNTRSSTPRLLPFLAGGAPAFHRSREQRAAPVTGKHRHSK